jgi:hypothetical protein
VADSILSNSLFLNNIVLGGRVVESVYWYIWNKLVGCNKLS